MLNAQDGPSTVLGSVHEGRSGYEPPTLPVEIISLIGLQVKGKLEPTCGLGLLMTLTASNSLFLHQYYEHYRLTFWSEYLK